MGDCPYRLGKIGPGEPGVQPLKGQAEALGEDRLLEARAFPFEVFGLDVGVAEGLQQLDRGILCQAQLIPAGGFGGHGWQSRCTQSSRPSDFFTSAAEFTCSFQSRTMKRSSSSIRPGSVPLWRRMASMIRLRTPIT